MLFDPVLSTLLYDDEPVPDPFFGPRPLCSHCHRRIEGTVHLENGKYFDDYCWGLRAVLEAAEDKAARQQRYRSGTNRPLDRERMGHRSQ